jgi:uncharacterized alkaline shock family protein YloU
VSTTAEQPGPSQPATETAVDRRVGRPYETAAHYLETTDRGTTHIEPRVVEKVAAHAVREVDNATGAARRVLGFPLGTTDSSTGASVRARVDGSFAAVDVTMTVVYPASILDVTRTTRRHVRERVAELTGVQVEQVDITVAGTAIQRPAPRRVR